MKKLLILSAITATMSGCAGMKLNPYTDLSEWGQAMQAVHLADTLQTNAIVDSRCFNEVNPVTRRIIGSNPTHTQVALWSVGASYVYAQIDQAVERSDLPKWGKTLIRGFSLSYAVGNVANNHEIGLRFSTNNEPSNGCIE